jgi:hypothetical protein
MGETHLTVDSINWSHFSPEKVDGDLLEIVKTVSLLEYNALNYAEYLCKIFAADPVMRSFLRGWGEEEVEHGIVLGRWVELADPVYDFQAAVRRFRDNFKMPELSQPAPFRNSPPGELVAQSIVETGTSSLYSAIADAAQEPVLQVLSRGIAADEFRHYDLFCAHMERYQERRRIGRIQRIRVAVARIAEIKDDELACAYHAANLYDRPYDRARAAHAYARRAFRLYHRRHVARGIGMAARVCGFGDAGFWARCAVPVVWWLLSTRVRRA